MDNWKKKTPRLQGAAGWYLLILGLLFLGLALPLQAQAAFTLTVKGSDGATLADYRWLVEEDVNFHQDPALGILSAADAKAVALGLNFHRSYMPVAAKGLAADISGLTLDPAKYYYISVIPMTAGSYSIGGAPIKPGQTSATVILNKLPLPTAQISVFVFEDNNRINGVPDLPQERGLPGFQVVVTDAGGRYGASGGQMNVDVFGNPFGTTYKKNGQIDVLGSGVILTNENGVALIKNLYPGKYGITVSPPDGSWHQTSTIEGTPTIDAWVKANEPPFFVEFGPAGHHADFGFVKQFDNTGTLPGTPVVGISGRVVSTHMSRPPDYTMWPGTPFPAAWIGINDVAGVGVYSSPANPDSTFQTPALPAGTYQLVMWDDNLDIVIATTNVTVNPDGTCGPLGLSCDLGDVGVFDWNGTLQGRVFFDDNEDGFPDPDPSEPGLDNHVVNIRWRDGSVYNSMTTGPNGEYGFSEVFPFFHWLVAEVGFATMKATGATVVVDAGGPVYPDDGWLWPSDGRLTPQLQDSADPANVWGTSLYRTETGPVLVEPFQLFLGQTNVIHWGKVNYGPGPDGQYGTPDDENGGISGMVSYDTTRAENDPQFGVVETWQPGIPRVTVNLWSDDGQTLLNTTTTDSWDDSLPDRCPGDPADLFFDLSGGGLGDCYDGLRNFNQVRPGVFDGGYAFTTYFVDSITGQPVAFGTPGALEVPLPTGLYIVEVIPPAGYEIVKAQDKNVDFGDEYTPGLLALPAECAGAPYNVPAELALFPGVPHAFYDPTSTAYIPGSDPVTNPVVLNTCDRKLVQVSPGKNAAADFFLFTEVPVAAHLVGMILNDFANEFDPANPNFGEKFAPSFLPVGFYDYLGHEVARVYADQYGRYNALVPSTFTANVPSPSGFAPNMLTACMNDPGPIPDPANPGQWKIDPNFNSQYTQFCYTFQYMPGVTTYLDTPVLPIAAFAGQKQFPLDCEFPDGTPVILTASSPLNGVGGGPYVSAPGGSLTVTSMGSTEVLNPAYDGTVATDRFVNRDYGFGASGSASLIAANGTAYLLTVVGWDPGVINATVPATVPGRGASYQLAITRGDNGLSTVMGLTVTVGLPTGIKVTQVLPPTDALATPITDAIEKSKAGDLILVAPGVYQELVIMSRQVRLQGWGAPSVFINAVKRPAEKLQLWRDRINKIVKNTNYLLPGQAVGFDPANNEPGLLNNAEGAGVLVLAESKQGANTWTQANNARIDGVTITGSDIGGAIVVNGYAQYLQITNNRLFANEGHSGGGIRVGHPLLLDPNDIPVDAQNYFVKIHHNRITQNGSIGGEGGGIALFTGAKGYQVTENFICGNFSSGTGGGIGQKGLCDAPVNQPNLIARNKILFNQSFNQMPGSNAVGGGIAIHGILPVGGVGLTQGTGNVTVDSNLIQGNLAGAGDGGGIRVAFADGGNATPHAINIVNNMIVNNVAGMAGGGISLQDTLGTRIIHNTIAHNDSTATAGDAFPTGAAGGISEPQPAGVVSHGHSPAFAAAVGAGFSNPQLINDIIWKNRSFYWDINITNADGIPVGGLVEAVPFFQDLAVLGAAGALSPQACLLTSSGGDPSFVRGYFNGPSGLNAFPENQTPLTAAAVDEGGNFIDLRFGPLSLYEDATPGDGSPGTLFGNYHITPGSAARNAGATTDRSANTGIPALDFDFDRQPRPNTAGTIDIGADELP